MKKYIVGIVIAILLLILGLSVFFNFTLFLALLGNEGGGNYESSTYFELEHIEGSRSKSGKKVLVVELYGVIGYSVQGRAYADMVTEFVQTLRYAAKRSDVGAIVIRIDSPGGEVTASDVLYHEISKVASDLPVVIYMESVAASGGYYAAMGGEYVMANELTTTGSIGVIFQTVNFKDLTEKIGLKFVTFKSGAMKDLLNPSRNVTEEERELLNNLVMQVYGKFVRIVAKERGLDEQSLRNGVADGRIITGKDAVVAGLIDETGYSEDAFAKARSLAKMDKDAPVYTVFPKPNFNQLLRLWSQAPSTPEVRLRLQPSAVQLDQGKFYFILPQAVQR